jgi:plastocyanin
VSGGIAIRASATGPTRLLLSLAILTALVVFLAMSAAPSAAAVAPAPVEGCAWQRHAKVAFKRVYRHGQRRRVKRVKRWWTCAAAPSALSPQPALPVPPVTEAPPSEGPQPEPEVGHLGVKAVEYSYTLSRPEVESGEVIVELNNQGEDPHNLVLEHEGTLDPTQEIPATPSTKQASARLALSPGTYRLYCSLYKHEAKGMEATLVVSG